MMTKGQKEKKAFVEGTLSETMREACAWVNRLEYEVRLYEEFVTIVCQNDYTYLVCVTGDSKSAIISDVIKEINRH